MSETSYCESCKRDLFTKYFNKSKGKCLKRCKHCVNEGKHRKELEKTISDHYDDIYPEVILTSDDFVGTRTAPLLQNQRRPGYSLCGPKSKDYTRELLTYKLWLVENHKLQVADVDKVLNDYKV